MKRVLFGLAAAALLAVGAGSSASANTQTLTLAPSDYVLITDQFPSGSGHFDGTNANDQFDFTVDTAGKISSNSVLLTSVSNFDIELFQGATHLSLTSLLTAGITYTLHISGDYIAPAQYGGKVFVSAASTVPLPPALLLFATTLGGLGFISYRRRSAPTA